MGDVIKGIFGGSSKQDAQIASARAEQLVSAERQRGDLQREEARKSVKAVAPRGQRLFRAESGEGRKTTLA